MSGIRYVLQVKVPHQSGVGSYYLDSEGYWNTVDGGSDLSYLREQRDIVSKFWKHVRIMQNKQTVIEECEVQ